MKEKELTKNKKVLNRSREHTDQHEGGLLSIFKPFGTGMRSIFIPFIFVLMLCFPPAVTRGDDVTYSRKSVSFVDKLIVINGGRVPEEYAGLLLEQINAAVTLKRFDYNPLPEVFVTRFRKEAGRIWRRKGDFDTEDAAAVLERTVLTPIMKILEEERTARAESLVEEWNSETFAVRIAKETGVTSEEISTVMNAAYICVPFLVNFVVNQTGKDVVVTITGGVSWFHVDNTGDVPRIEPLVNRLFTTTGRAVRRRRYSTSMGNMNATGFAAWTAIKALGANMEVATKSMEEFRLTIPVLEMVGSLARFRFGDEEGLSLDDRFYAVEYFKDETGERKHQRVGFLRTVSVGGKNKGSLSGARLVGGKCETGMLLEENPRLGLDIGAGVGMAPVSVSGGDIYDSMTQFTVDFVGDEELQPVYGYMDVAYNLAGVIGVSQFFTGFRAGIGPVTLDIRTQDGFWGGNWENEQVVARWDFLEGYLLKKVWIRRFAIDFTAAYAFTDIAFPYDGLSGQNLEFSAWSMGFSGGLGLEFALTANSNVGFSVNRFISGATGWDISDDSGDYRLNDGATPSTVDFSGTGWNVWLTWSPPSLSFDPFGWLRGYMGI